MSCYECCDKTYERCWYCLLPVCAEHSKQVQLWFTRRPVLICATCREKLQEAVEEEQALYWHAK